MAQLPPSKSMELHSSSSLINNKKASSIFAILQEKNPEPQTELHYTNNFTLLVAIVLSAQATDIGVNKATKSLFIIADTPEKIFALGEEKLKSYIKTIGLFNSKAKNIIALSSKIINEFSGEVPTKLEQLRELPGVGNKTANVWLNCALGLPTIAVDTHVFRVSNRIGLVNAKNADSCQAQLEKIVPDEYKKHAHHWLILHGRYVCKARSPDCKNCVISKFCDYYEAEK